jgi:hypothetical protein
MEPFFSDSEIAPQCCISALKFTSPRSAAF